MIQSKATKFELKCPKGTRDFHPKQSAIRREVIKKIVGVFKRHGAVEIDTPVFELKSVLMGKYGEQSRLIYDLNDQGGELCSLRYDLTVPFARFMGMNTNIKKIKRFHIGKVYRRDQPAIAKGRFRQFYQCDFDIAGDYDSMIPDAQILAIMQQILEELGVDKFLVKVNHRKILESIVSQAGCDSKMFKLICSSIDKLDKLPWEKVESELLSKGVTPQQAEKIKKFIAFKGKPFEILKLVEESTLFGENSEHVMNVLKDMRKLFNFLEAMNRLGKIELDFSLARGLDYYTGLIYEIVLTENENDLGAISGGGRYDDLIGMFCEHQIPAVGGSIGIQRLFTILEAKYGDKIKETETEVFVASIGETDPCRKLAVLAELWKHGIKAETLYVQTAKTNKQIQHVLKNSIPMMIWVGGEELQNSELKLKIMSTHQELVVKKDNLIEEIKPHIEKLRAEVANI